MKTTTRILPPQAEIYVVGQTYGGAYWTRQDYRVILRAVHDDEWDVEIEDTSTTLDTITLNVEQAIDILAAISNGENYAEVPGLSVSPRWDVGCGLSEDQVVLHDFNEVQAWLRYFLSYDAWDPANTEWEY